MMKPNLSIATGLRRLSSEKVSESPFSTGNTSPQTKTSQYLKSSYGDFQTKKQLGSSLKGLLSPVDYKLVEMQTKANALKLDEDTAKPSPKGSARLSGHIILNGNEQSNEIYAKGGLHQKKKSFDSKIDSQYDETLGSKTKLPNTNSMSHTRSQTSTNIYLKDVEYVVNPMFSPVNGPPKYITHRQSDPLADSISPKAIQVKKTSGAQDVKTGLNQEYTLKKESHSAKMMAKSSLNQFFETKKGIAEQRFEEGSSDEYQPGTKSKVTKEKGAQLHLNKMKDGKKSPSMNVSPRVEAYNNLHAYTGANGVKQEFETVQTVKNKSSMGSLYSRQREENQEFSKTATALKNSPKKGASKGVKKDCFFPKAKAIDAPTLQNKIKKGEIDLKDENEEVHVRPRTTKHSEPNIQKDINTFIFSGFNNQLKRNSAAQIYNSASLVESNLQSTRSAVDRSEKQNFLKEDQKSAKGPGPKPTSAVEIDVKLTSESNAEDAHTLSKKSSVSQLTQNPNAKFMLLRKQVQDKRANRGFKSAGQDMFDLHYYPADLHDKKDQPSSSTKQGSDIQYYLPDTTHTSTKLPGQAQLNEVFARVSKVLETYQRKEKTWEEEKRKLMAEIQMLRGGKQQK